MPLDESLLALLGDQLEGVHPEPVHLPVVGRDALIAQQPCQLHPNIMAASNSNSNSNSDPQDPYVCEHILLTAVQRFHVTSTHL